MSEAKERSEWLLDVVVGYLKSPAYTVPVMGFIDEKCIVFDADEENKLVYTELHEEFKQLVERLLDEFLEEIGLSPEEFTEACTRGGNSHLERFATNQILAVDDFLSFKRMMVKRNKELELEVLRHMKRMQEKTSKKEETPAEPEKKEQAETEDELSKAMQLSKESFAHEDEDEALREAIRRSLEIQESQKPPSETDDEAELKSALELSVTIAEIEKKEAEREAAELEHAIALSLALEERRRAEEENKKADIEKKKDVIPGAAAPDEKVSHKEEGVKPTDTPEVSKDCDEEWRKIEERKLRELAAIRRQKMRTIQEQAKAETQGTKPVQQIAKEGVSAQEREAHLKALRNELLKQKQEARSQQLKEYEEQKKSSSAGKPPAPTKQPTLEDLKRAEMRTALLSKLKADLSSE